MGCPELSPRPAAAAKKEAAKRSSQKCGLEKALGQGKKQNWGGRGKVAFKMTKQFVIRRVAGEAVFKIRIISKPGN